MSDDITDWLQDMSACADCPHPEGCPLDACQQGMTLNHRLTWLSPCSCGDPADCQDCT